MIRSLSPKVDIVDVDGRYTLRWGYFELEGLTFEESEIVLDQIKARSFDPVAWKNCRSKVAYLDKEKTARGLGGHAA
jgi:hypothetical protein